MDGRGGSDFGSFFNAQQHHLHAIETAATSLPTTKQIFPPSFPSATIAAESAKRKRGRPRKYGAPSLHSLSLPTSVMPAATSSSPSPLRPSPAASLKKKKAKCSNPSAKKAQLRALGNAGQGFTPHVITVSAGEDLVNKLISMMQQGERAICVLSATGSILNPSLCQPASSHANGTYEGMFDIISLSGALIYTKAGSAVSRTGGLRICLCGVNGHIVGGSVDGPLMAAGPVQVIAGSFFIDINSDFNSTTKTDDYTTKLSTEAVAGATLTSPMSMESAFGSSRRVTSSRGSDDYQSLGGAYHLYQPRPIFPSPDWDGPSN